MGAAIETKYEQRRKYQRHKVPKGLLVGWKSAGQRKVSRAETFGMGGIFIYTTTPPDVGSMLELLFDLPSGEIRARSLVRSVRPGKGMGVQFVHMRPEDRSRLNRFLSTWTPEAEQSSGEDTKQKKASASKPLQTASVSNSAATSTIPPASQKPIETIDTSAFELELKSMLELIERGTHYHLLGVTNESSTSQIKKNFYALARKFHPDHHMERSGNLKSLQDLMAAFSEAYRILGDEQKRAEYDNHLATTGTFNIRTGKSESQETVDVCFVRANEMLRARNFAGSILWLRKCVNLAPGESKYHTMLARSLSTISEYRDEAMLHYNKAIELDPWNATALFQMGELYEQIHLPWRARPLYEKVIEISPMHAKARAKLAEFDSKEKEEKASPVSRWFSRKD